MAFRAIGQLRLDSACIASHEGWRLHLSFGAVLLARHCFSTEVTAKWERGSGRMDRIKSSINHGRRGGVDFKLCVTGVRSTIGTIASSAFTFCSSFV
jgi:hypothetical protein